jgi:hypothetical protein
MRPDQLARLDDLAKDLADVFLAEADPTEWSGYGKPAADMSQQERGDRYWCKKNAMATAGVLRFALDLKAHTPAGTSGVSDDEAAADMDRRIADAERRAKRAVDAAVSRAQARSKVSTRARPG